MITFKKNAENFTCEKCKAQVIGNGYTNHCPQCLWSKHVDINPGDRASDCGMLMQPVGVSKKGETFNITHKCTTCAHTKKNKISPDDNFDLVIKLASDTPLP